MSEVRCPGGFFVKGTPNRGRIAQDIEIQIRGKEECVRRSKSGVPGARGNPHEMNAELWTYRARYNNTNE